MKTSVCLFVLAVGGSVCACAQTAQTANTPTAPVAHRPYPSGEATPLGAKIAALLADPAVSRAHWGIAVTALDGTPIYGHGEAELYRPASNNKLFTTAAAMALLGPDSTINTYVGYPPPDASGISNGDLVLHGEGDANLSGDDLPYLTPAEKQARDAAAKAPGTPVVTPDPFRVMDDFAADVARAGVQRIDGNIVGDDTRWTWEPYPIAWDIGDMITDDGAPVSALSFIDNALTVKVTAGAKAGDPATVSITPAIGPGIDYYQLEASVTTVAAGQHASFDIARAPGAKLVRVYGSVAVGETHTDGIAIQDPADFAAEVLRQRLIAHGIEVTGVAKAQHRWPTDAESFYHESHEPIRSDIVTAHPPGLGGENNTSVSVHVSPTLAKDIYLTLKVSQNLHAELMLERLGRKRGADTLTHSTTAQGVRVVRQFAIDAGIDGDDFVLYDGSGMSSHDLIAPRALAQLLAYAQSQPWFAAWKAALPVGGVDGSLRSRFPDAPLKGHVFAKTGTLGESRALSGYLDCASGKQVIFSIMVDDHSPANAADRMTMDRIVAAIAATE